MFKEENRINKPLSFENLISAIEDLEHKNIISFDNFKKLSFLEIKKKYFSMSNPTMIDRAIIKITDQKNGKEDPSTHTVITETIKNKKVVKTSMCITQL